MQWAFWDDERPPRTPRAGSTDREPEPLEDEPTSRVPDDAQPPPTPPGYDADALARLENADTALMASPPPPVPTELSQDSLIMAVVCQYGHASPQNATLLPDLRQPDHAPRAHG